MSVLTPPFEEMGKEYGKQFKVFLRAFYDGYVGIPEWRDPALIDASHRSVSETIARELLAKEDHLLRAVTAAWEDLLARYRRATLNPPKTEGP